MKSLKFSLAGLTCESCVKLATNRLKQVPGVQVVKIDLTTGATEVQGEESLNKEALAQSLADTHYSIVK